MARWLQHTRRNKYKNKSQHVLRHLRWSTNIFVLFYRAEISFRQTFSRLNIVMGFYLLKFVPFSINILEGYCASISEVFWQNVVFFFFFSLHSPCHRHHHEAIYHNFIISARLSDFSTEETKIFIPRHIEIIIFFCSRSIFQTTEDGKARYKKISYKSECFASISCLSYLSPV